MKDFIKDVNSNAGEYGGIPFWSWNDRLEENELRRQIRIMKELGMKGFFMHARGGLETGYLSDEWYECINVCIDEAKKLDMEAWAYDENGWPSGFAGGKVLENPLNFATYLKFEEAAAFPEIKNAAPPERRVLAVYVKEDGIFRPVKDIDDAGGSENFYIIYQCFDSSYVDTMDARVTKEFISYTHEEYKRRTGDSFGGVMPGFFTDEPQYYRYATAWSNTLPSEFEKAYGYSIFDKLPALFTDFEGADEFRYDYWYLCHKLFINNFIKVIYDWCDENGCQITGHAIEESLLFTQMWCIGGIMPFYEYEHIPGIDYLGRGISSDLSGKQVGSVAAQLGKKKVLSEMFACCGWDVTPKELKKIAELQYSAGVNVMCHHLYPYSIRGQRKRDYPANYSEHLPWQNVLGDFVRYFNRLGYILAMGKEKVNTLIIHPIHSEYLTYKREMDLESVRPIEESFGAVITRFSDNQIPYHLGDESIMSRHASVKGDKLVVGECEYEYVVLPKIYTLDSSTVKLIKDFAANGGKLLMLDNAPDRIDGRKADLSWLKSNVTFDDIKNAAYASAINKADGGSCPGLKLMTRETDYGRIYYFVNVSGVNYDEVKLDFAECSGVYEIFLEEADWKNTPVKSRETARRVGGVSLCTSFEDGKSRIFISSSAKAEGHAEADTRRKCGSDEPIVLKSEYRLTNKCVNALTLDYAEPSYDGISFEEAQPIIEIHDKLLRSRYRGELYLKFSFNIEKVPAAISMACEPMKYRSISVNGKEVGLSENWWLDRSFRTADILPFIKTGENEILMSFDYYQRDYVYYVLYGGVSESLRNCLAFDTEIEAVYLFGDFAVQTEADKFTPSERLSYCYTGDFKITESKDTVCADNVIKDGLPFFAGHLELEQSFESDREHGELWLDGRFSYADVYLNGAFVRRLMFTDHCDVSGFLRKGENTIRLVLCNSNRNLLGPHHFADPEPYALGPWNFSLENSWVDGKCDYFKERYSFVRFGLNAVIR